MTRVLTCLGMMSVLLLTFTVSSGFVPNGYHKAYARGDLDALGAKIRESINNLITEELSGSAGQNPSSSSGSSGLTTPSSSTTPTFLTLSIGFRGDVFFGKIFNPNDGKPVEGAAITFTGTNEMGMTVPIHTVTGTDSRGFYDVIVPHHEVEGLVFVTAHYAGGAANAAFVASDSEPVRL
jgi:hypothetical protein